MRRVAALIVALVLLGGLGYVTLNRVDPTPGVAPALAGAPASADRLARGAYLATAADCIACHTVPDSGRPFAGGVAFVLPIGTIYSSNITPDPVTGIGAFTDDEFVRAVREGIGRHGEHLYPAFPYTSYTQLSRSDVLAIKAYLDAQPGIKQANRANDLGFPFNQRWAVGFWNAAFFKERRFSADLAHTAEWNSGAYLATALGHCAECHTPRNLAFGLEHGKELAGAELQGWRAYNITADTAYGIGAWSDADLAAYLTTGLAARHAAAGGPMGEAVAHSLQFLAPPDVDALVAYLRSVPAQTGGRPIVVEADALPATASTQSMPANSELLAPSPGLQLFAGACASCHDWNGQGRESPYAALRGTRGVNDVAGDNVVAAILQGAHLRIAEHDVVMPAFAAAYSNTEIADLANYVIGQFGGKEGLVTARQVGERRTSASE